MIWNKKKDLWFDNIQKQYLFYVLKNMKKKQWNWMTLVWPVVSDSQHIFTSEVVTKEFRPELSKFYTRVWIYILVTKIWNSMFLPLLNEGGRHIFKNLSSSTPHTKTQKLQNCETKEF